MQKLQLIGVLLMAVGLALAAYGTFQDPLNVPIQNFDQISTAEKTRLAESSERHKAIGLFGLVTLLLGVISFAVASVVKSSNDEP